MQTVNAIRNLTPEQQLALPVEVVMAAQQDASTIGYLTGMAETTQRATSDDRTRRETRVKLDALGSMQARTAIAPSYAPLS